MKWDYVPLSFSTFVMHPVLEGHHCWAGEAHVQQQPAPWYALPRHAGTHGEEQLCGAPTGACDREQPGSSCLSAQELPWPLEERWPCVGHVGLARASGSKGKSGNAVPKGKAQSRRFGLLLA